MIPTPLPNHAASKKQLTSSQKFPLLSATDIASMPRASWLIHNLFPQAGIGCVGGPSGCSKTFLCLGMGAAVATGSMWFGLRTTRCNVVFVVLEGQSGFKQRIEAWESHNNQKFPTNVWFLFTPFALNSTDDPIALAEQINHHGGAGLIIIDTLSKASPDADENSSRDMGRVIAGATALQSATGSMVILIHHPGKDVGRGLRGHSSLYAALDTVMLVDKNGDRNYWTISKSKDGKDGISHAFATPEIEIGFDSFGDPVTSLVVEPIGDSLKLSPKHELRGGNQKNIMEGFTDLVLQQRQLASAMGNEWPEGIPFDEAILNLKTRLQTVSEKHRQLRTKEALISLIEKGYILATGDILNIPTQNG